MYPINFFFIRNYIISELYNSELFEKNKIIIKWEGVTNLYHAGITSSHKVSQSKWVSLWCNGSFPSTEREIWIIFQPNYHFFVRFTFSVVVCKIIIILTKTQNCKTKKNWEIEKNKTFKRCQGDHQPWHYLQNGRSVRFTCM